MSMLRGLRYPTALAFGLLLTAAIFWSLWSFTNVVFEIPAIKTVKIDFSSTRIDTPPEKKFAEEEIKKPPVIEKTETLKLTGDDVQNIPFVVTTLLEAPVVGDTGFGVNQDRDVIPLVRINPEYPQRALREGIEGWAQVQFTITGTGTVTDVVVVESSPPRIFDDAAVKAVSRWRYNPKVEGAVAVERVGVQTILRFDLEEE